MSAKSDFQHIGWLTATSSTFTTSDGRPVSHWKFAATTETGVWSTWAKHFRSHYIPDAMIDQLRKGTSHKTRAEFLRALIFPDDKNPPGPSVRSGDFCEVLVADLLESDFGFYVPRTRFHQKSIRNESTKGSDVIAIKFNSPGSISSEDLLAIYEVKGKLTGKLEQESSRLQDAINDSCKDDMRCAESLNAAKRRLLEEGKEEEANIIERFQNATDTPYDYRPGAAAVISSTCWSIKQLDVTTCEGHPYAQVLHLMLIEADDFMSVASELYRLAADEA
jgi:hypothetical protein